MPPDVAKRPSMARSLRVQWLKTSRWGPPERGAPPCVDLGRCPIRPAIRGEEAFVEAKSARPLEHARAEVCDLVGSWPQATPRLALEADTGAGKTTAAIARCAEHAVGPPLVAGILLYVVHDRQRVEEMVGRLRGEVARRGGEAPLVVDLLGRQALDEGAGRDWHDGRFGCKAHALASRAGERGRQVEHEVCKPCFYRPACKARGYLRHTKDAEGAAIVVTTVAKLAGISKRLWTRIGAVVCDEDVVPGLLRPFWVLAADLERAARFIRRQRRKVGAGPRTKALLAVLRLVEGTLEALADQKGTGGGPLVLSLPEDCDRYATDEGLRELQEAMPRSVVRGGGRQMVREDERAPAEWERARPDWTPRQVWGRFLSSMRDDLAEGDGRRTATVRVVGRGRGRARLHVLRFDDRTIAYLRSRPLLVMDATLSPLVAPILDVAPRAVRYDQGRTIVQALGPLLRLSDLVRGRGGYARLTPAGRRAVAQIAAWVGGRRGYVLCRKALEPLLRAEAQRYYELRRLDVVTVKRERAWDAERDAVAFVVLGRYAKNSLACAREAHAARAVVRRLTGSTVTLDALNPPPRALPYRGRGAALRYRGELVERVTRHLEDPLAAHLQEADRVATVAQFLGRDRAGRAEVLLLRGDPTTGADALVEAKDLPVAVPADRRVLVGGRTRV